VQSLQRTAVTSAAVTEARSCLRCSRCLSRLRCTAAVTCGSNPSLGLGKEVLLQLVFV
jgi:hypothetical protein